MSGTRVESARCWNCQHYDRKAEVKLEPKHTGKYRAPQFRSICLVDANAPKAGHRPLSSMTPSFVTGADRVGVIGTPGGSRIITMVALGILDWIGGGSVEHAVALPRYHHQYLPDQVQFEPGALSESDQATLTAMGHTLAPLTASYGNMHAVWWDKGNNALRAASDPRGVGEATVVTVKKPAK